MALDADFADNLSLTQVAQAVEHLQDANRKEHPGIQRIFIEVKNLMKLSPTSTE